MTRVVALEVIILFGGVARAAEDPLPSWNDTLARVAIIAFVEAVSSQDSPDFVAPDGRIAVFDNDGTLWVEQPVYTQLAFAMDRVKAVEPLVGVRWSYLRAEIELSGGGAVNLPQADRSENFIDPIVGVRVGSGLSENWLTLISADVGGFGLGSDYSWNVQGYIGYRMAMFSIPTVLSVGYRALHQKYKDGDFKWDVTQHGRILGAIYSF